jgi:D-hexose-6-phosphate mutarotase
MLLEISVPVYRRDKWARLERDGKIEVSSEVDTLSEGYQALKQEIDALVSQIDAETRLAETALNLQLEINEKTRRLTELWEPPEAEFQPLLDFQNEILQ